MAAPEMAIATHGTRKKDITAHVGMSIIPFLNAAPTSNKIGKRPSPNNDKMNDTRRLCSESAEMDAQKPSGVSVN